MFSRKVYSQQRVLATEQCSLPRAPAGRFDTAEGDLVPSFVHYLQDMPDIRKQCKND